MRLKDCLELGIECGLVTIGEVIISCSKSIFSFGVEEGVTSTS